MKWNPETTTYARVISLFYPNRAEARDFIGAVNNLHKGMHYLPMDRMGRAQRLMQIAMKRLQKEFYQILSLNRAHLGPESISTRSSRTSTASIASVESDDDGGGAKETTSDEVVDHSSTLAMADLRLIAECMISSGYAKECLKIYTTIRKSIVDEGIYKLGVERLTSSQIRKMDRRALEMRTQNWISAVRSAVKILFNGERILCDHVFASSDSIRESCFKDITTEGATILFLFPENVAKNSKKTPEKIFRLLDMYAALSEHLPQIGAIFSFRSTLDIKSQALTSLIKLAEFGRATLKDLEKDVSKNSAKLPIASGGIDQLTIDTMNHLSALADYGNNLSDILAKSLPAVPPESFSESDGSPAAEISLRIARLILVLLCKLDAKAKYYKDVSVAYLFLANNLQYVVVKVRSSNLKHILGEEWREKHESRVKQFAASYERLGWNNVVDCIPAAAEITPEKVEEIFREFHKSFNQAYRKQSLCVVPDSELREDMKCSIARKIIPSYRSFYYAQLPAMERERTAASGVWFTPHDLGHCLWDVFSENLQSGSSSSFTSAPPHSRPSGACLEK